MEYKYIVLTNTTIGAFMSQLDGNIVLISLPTIIRELPGTTAFDAIWVIIGYMLVTATLLLTFGRLADIYGRVRLYNLGFAVFTIGSALCSLAPNGDSLVLFRLIQGVGGALIFSNNAAILTDAFPAEERGRAIGFNQVLGVSGSVIGLVGGGVLTAALGWRSIFWINIPVGILATAWAFKRLKELAKLRREPLDPLGNGLFASGLSIFLIGLTLGAISAYNWAEIFMIISGLGILGLFLFVEVKARSPMMDVTLFKNKTFSSGMISNLLGSVARGAIGLLLVFYFQGALLLNALTAGILIIPFSLAFVSAGPLSGYLSDKYGARRFSTAGLAISAVACLWFALLPAKIPYDILVLPMILVGVGSGMFVAPNIASIMNATPAIRRGIAAGMSATMIMVGFLLSLGFAFAILATSMPRSTMEAIFAGLPVAANALNVNLFTNALHRIFLLLAAINVIAALSSSVVSPKRFGQRPIRGTSRLTKVRG